MLEEPKMCVPLLRSEISGSTCLCVEQGLSPLGTNGEVCSTEVSVNSVDMIHRRATPKMTDLKIPAQFSPYFHFKALLFGFTVPGSLNLIVAEANHVTKT